MQKLDDIYEYGLEMKKYIEELRVVDATISEVSLQKSKCITFQNQSKRIWVECKHL